MRQFLVQYRKDFCTNFSTFNAFAIVGIYYVLSLFFAIYFGDYYLRESLVMNSYFVSQPVILMLIIPAVTMRSWAEEAKSGTIEMLLTQPIGYFKLVFAKFFAAYSFFAVMVLSSFMFFIVTDKLSVSDYGVVLGGYGGLLLCGAFFTAIGCAVSSACRNNILSYICTIFVLFFVTQTEFAPVSFGALVIPFNCLGFNENYNAFLNGAIVWSNIFYFIAGTGLFLWLNTIFIGFRRKAFKKDKSLFYIFYFLLLMIFISGILGINLIFNKVFDITDDHKYTLTKENEDFLSNTAKRIDITLYEAKSKREEANSGYAVYAEFVERFLKMVEQKSGGAVRVEIVLVPSFSPLERRLIRDGVLFETDKFENKSFMAAEFSDNEGNRAMINTFSNLKQNLLEADIMRVIKQFGLEKKEIAVIAPYGELEDMSSFDNLLKEFYKTTYLDFNTLFIPPVFDAVIIINPTQISSEFLLAVEQYILSGGKAAIFSEPSLIGEDTDKPLLDFLANFGIMPVPSIEVTTRIDDVVLKLGAAAAIDNNTNRDIRSVLVNGAGEARFSSGDSYKAWPILELEGKTIAAASSGEYVSDNLRLAAQSAEIKAVSEKEGKVLFFYDSDMLKDYLYVSEESKGNGFYETFPLSDNMLFILRLLDYISGSSVESSLNYRHYAVNSFSIGNAVLAGVKERYKNITKELEDKISGLNSQKSAIYNKLDMQGFASVKNIGDISEISQNLEEAEDKLNQTKAMIVKEYQNIIVSITFVLICIFPLALLLIAVFIRGFYKRRKRLRIRRLVANVDTH